MTTPRLALAAAMLWLPASLALAQPTPTTGGDYDRVRASGLWWVGTLSGSLTPTTDLPLPPIIDIDALGIEDAESGFFGEGDIGLARRHRVRAAGSHRSSTGTTTVTIDLDVGGTPIPVPVPIDTAISISEIDASYNFLVVASDRVDVGVLAGIGYFQTEASASTPLGGEAGAFETPFPNLGGNVLVNPRGRFRAYIEATGFPRVTVDDFSGWKLHLIARAEIFFTDHVGAQIGFRTYQIDLEDDDIGAAVRLGWHGLMVGGTVRF